MPPTRPRPNPHDDSRSETSVSKLDREKSIDKRRQQNAPPPPSSQEKPLNGGASVSGVGGGGASTNANGTHAHEGIEGVSSPSFPLPPVASQALSLHLQAYQGIDEQTSKTE